MNSKFLPSVTVFFLSCQSLVSTPFRFSLNRKDKLSGHTDSKDSCRNFIKEMVFTFVVREVYGTVVLLHLSVSDTLVESHFRFTRTVKTTKQIKNILRVGPYVQRCPDSYRPLLREKTFSYVVQTCLPCLLH